MPAVDVPEVPASPAVPTPSRSARLAATIASGWLKTIATVSIGMIATPKLVHYLGAERFGIIRSAEQWFAYLEFFSFGLVPAVLVLLVRATTAGTQAVVAGTVWAGIRILVRQFRWTVPVGVAFFLSFPFLIEIPSNIETEYYWAAPAILLLILLGPFGVFRSVLEARQQGYLLNIGLILYALIVAVFGVLFAYFGLGLTGQYWALTLATGACMLVCFFLAGGMTRAFRTAAAVDLPIHEVWHLQWPLMVTGISNQINSMSDNLLASIVIGVEEVAALSLTQRLAQVANLFGASVNGSGIWIGLVDLRAKVGQAAYADRVAEVAKITVGIMLLVLAPVVACNQRFVGLWVGEAMYAGQLVTILTSLQLTIFSFWLLFAGLIDCLGLARRRVWASLVGTVLKLALIVPCTTWLGLSGLPLATILAYLFVEAWFAPWVLAQETGVSLKAIFAGVVRAAAVGGMWMAACFFIGNRSRYLPVGWLSLMAEASVLELGSLALGWLLILTPPERTSWQNRITNWIRKNKPLASHDA